MALEQAAELRAAVVVPVLEQEWALQAQQQALRSPEQESVQLVEVPDRELWKFAELGWEQARVEPR